MIDVAALERLSLFADLPRPRLQALADRMDEESYQRGDRVLRVGVSGSAFFVVTDGQAAVIVDASERARLHPGDAFGEGAILTGEPTGADVVAASEELRCAVLAGPELRPFLLENPSVAVKLLELSARRLRVANVWAG